MKNGNSAKLIMSFFKNNIMQLTDLSEASERTDFMQGPLTDYAMKNGFSLRALFDALDWLREWVATRNTSCQTPSRYAYRVLSSEETLCLSQEAKAYLYLLDHNQILRSEQREALLHLATEFPAPRVTYAILRMISMLVLLPEARLQANLYLLTEDDAYAPSIH